MWTICPIFMANQQPVPAALQQFVISCITNKPLTQKITALFPLCLKHKVMTSHQNIKVYLFLSLNFGLWDDSLQKSRWVSGACTIDSISMTTNTLKHNKPMLQVPLPFQGLKWPCRYLQITALCKAALSRAICQWPQERRQNRRQQTQASL